METAKCDRDDNQTILIPSLSDVLQPFTNHPYAQDLHPHQYQIISLSRAVQHTFQSAKLPKWVEVTFELKLKTN